MSTKLDYTIELDGQEYDITAAEVKSTLAIKESIIDSSTKKPKTIAKNYNGANTVQLNVVPSSGGAFTGPIQVPSVDNPEDLDNKDYVANIGNLNTLIETIKGFPTYRWEGSELKPLIIRAGDSAKFSPLKVVLYSDPNNNNPTDITFKDEASNDMECWFLAFNDQTGWMSLGHYAYDTSEEKYLTTYVDLFVAAAALAANANYATTAGHATTSDGAYQVQAQDGSGDPYTYDHFVDLFSIIGKDTTFWQRVKDFFNGTTNNTGETLAKLRTDLDNHTSTWHLKEADYTQHCAAFTSHVAIEAKHRKITWGTAEPESASGDTGDIYIMLES